MVVGAERYLFTIEEFDRLFEADIFGEDDRIEFVDGELVRMSSVGGRHIRTINRTTGLFLGLNDPTIQISVQNPFRIDNRASFIPDLMVLRTPHDTNEVPTTDEVLLVIEVGDSSRNYDRNTKLPRYAAAGLPEAWIFDLVDERIERHTEPRDGVYQQVAIAGRGERIASTMLPNLNFDVDALLGPREAADAE
jgi:Uma2 family endonuclease